MLKPKLIVLLVLVGVLGWGIYQTCCAVRPVELGKQEVEQLAEQAFAKYLQINSLSVTAFEREFVRWDDKVDVWHVGYRTLPGEKERLVSIIVGKYGGVEMHTSGPSP